MEHKGTNSQNKWDALQDKINEDSFGTRDFMWKRMKRKTEKGINEASFGMRDFHGRNKRNAKRRKGTVKRLARRNHRFLSFEML